MESPVNDELSHGVIALIWCKPIKRWVTVKNQDGSYTLAWAMRGEGETCEETLNRLIRQDLGMKGREPFSKRNIVSADTGKGYYFSYYNVTIDTHEIFYCNRFALVEFSTFGRVEEILFRSGKIYPKDITAIVRHKKDLNPPIE